MSLCRCAATPSVKRNEQESRLSAFLLGFLFVLPASSLGRVSRVTLPRSLRAQLQQIADVADIAVSCSLQFATRSELHMCARARALFVLSRSLTLSFSLALRETRTVRTSRLHRVDRWCAIAAVRTRHRVPSGFVARSDPQRRTEVIGREEQSATSSLSAKG